ncbi:YggU family protein [Candidatus Woesearchaeota archaeon]|nr:YggU family protein [Candidatus Woesearchaeota archaeon]
MIAKDVFRVLVRPNARKSAILGFDDARQAYRVAIAAPAEGNRANLELMRFLSKELGRKVRIVSGLRNKLKTIRADQ